MKIDETNLAIIKHLRDGRKYFKKIANDLSITENTVRARITKLMNEGVLDIVGLVAPETLGGHCLVQIGIKLSTTRDLVKKGEEFSKVKGVVSVCVVTGRFDLMATVLLNDQFNLLNFYTDEMSKIKEVESIETFVVYKSFNLKVPYVL
jgi:Lrp/AsnC family transcriptional regulator, regulator for asnA, asnC and gidA